MTHTVAAREANQRFSDPLGYAASQEEAIAIILQARAVRFCTLTCKGKLARTSEIAMDQVWRGAATIFAVDETGLVDRIDTVSDHNWSFWDVNIRGLRNERTVAG